MTKTFVAVAVTTAILTMTSAAGAAVIQNGSFEANAQAAGTGASFAVGSTGITGWTVVNHGGTTVSDGREIAMLGNGSFGIDTPFGTDFLDLTGYNDSSPFAGVAQDVVTTVGQAYTLTFWLGTSTSNGAYVGPISVLASAGGTALTITNAGRASTTVNSSTWTQQLLNFTATAATTTISIVGNTSAGGQFIGLDNVSIADRVVATVPEPASWALMVGGFGLIGSAMRRRQRTIATFA